MAKLYIQNTPFTQIANEVLKDPQISFGAKGVFAYLFSKPESWDFAAERIALEAKEKRKPILKLLKELEDKGYLSRKKMPSGRMEYYMKYTKDGQKPESQFGTLATDPKSQISTEQIRHGAELGLISNKDIKVIKNKSNIAGETPANTEVPELIKTFESINASCKRYYGNKTQRKACEDLISTYGFERVTKVVMQALPKTNGIAWFPTITTPLQLFEKWSALEAAIKKHNDKKKTTTDKVGTRLW